MPKVTFIPDDVTVEVHEGENLLRAAMMADVRITASCGGDGTCGKCRVRVSKGAVDSKPSAKLSEEHAAKGYVLACLSQVTDDVTIDVPDESRPSPPPDRGTEAHPTSAILAADAFEKRLPSRRLDPPMADRVLELPEPDLVDNSSDEHRVRQALRRTYGIKDARSDWHALEHLPEAARGGDWTVTVRVISEDACARVLDVFPGAREISYAIAVDVGTTTVEAQLVDLSDGRVVAQAADYNAQVSRGEDVISRIIAASKPDGLAELADLVRGTVRGLAERLLEKAGADRESVATYIVAGNTVMTHLLLGITPKNIRNAPYIPVATRYPWLPAQELGLPGTSTTMLHAFPCPASYVGGDIVSGVLACGMPWTDKLTLFVDIGTNGEIVLGSKEWMVACSCSAGPAFEGGGMLHGMRAANGAIEQVRIDPASLEPMILTIGGAKPRGICGSGLIDVVSELFLAGALDRNGAFNVSAGGDRIREGEHGMEYVLVRSEDAAIDGDIVLTEVDIENLIRAKAAVFAGIGVLTESVDLQLSDIDEVIIAGAFGHYLDLDRVMLLGLLPEMPKERFSFLGNGSLMGARTVATSRAMMAAADDIAERMTYLELSVNAAFMEMYVSAMFLPHTDLSLFPESEARVAGQPGGG